MITSRLGAAAALATIAVVASSAAPGFADKLPGGGSTGTASVFKVNPVQSSGNEKLTDDSDSATAVPQSEYATVELRNLDGSGTLTGKWVRVESSTGPAAYSTTNTFVYNRHDDQFEQVMAYFWVNEAQEYLQALGFGSSLRPVNAQQQQVKVDQFGGDNSYQTDKPFRLRFGKGGVDDAEDAEVIVHEYGHAVQAAQQPGFGSSEEAGSIGEGWGDYFGITVGLDAAARYQWPVKTDTACSMDWDSTSYTSTEPHCIRRLDTDLTVGDKTGEVHHDGMIWSRALWDIRNGYIGLGLGSRRADTTIVDSHFDFAVDTSFSAAAQATYNKALARDGRAAARLVRDAFAARGITF
jgi:hypothetical protein